MDADVVSELARLEQLHAAGQLTNEQFAAARAGLLTDPGFVLPVQRSGPAAPTTVGRAEAAWGGAPPLRTPTAEAPPGAAGPWPPALPPLLGPTPPRHALQSPSRAWLWWLLAALVVAALVLAAVILRLTVWGPDQSQASPPAATGQVNPSRSQAAPSSSAQSSAPASSQPPSQPPSQRSSQPSSSRPQPPPASATQLAPNVVTADSTAPPGVDDSGRQVSYGAANLVDGRADTAWRTVGDASHQSLHFSFGRPVHLASVGLIPGYAKVDPSTGANRFLQNRRVLAVQWRTADGTTIVQNFRDEATLQTVSFDATTTGLDVTILRTTAPGERDFTAVSEVQFTGTAG